MEKTRVKKGEKYWGVEVFQETVKTVRYTEDEGYYDGEAYNAGNYFTDRDSAEQMARKLRAVLKGAEVIAMPSEEEMKDKAIDIAMNICGDDYWRDCEEAVNRATEWLKSKIVK